MSIAPKSLSRPLLLGRLDTWPNGRVLMRLLSGVTPNTTRFWWLLSQPMSVRWTSLLLPANNGSVCPSPTSTSVTLPRLVTTMRWALNPSLSSEIPHTDTWIGPPAPPNLMESETPSDVVLHIWSAPCFGRFPFIKQDIKTLAVGYNSAARTTSASPQPWVDTSPSLRSQDQGTLLSLLALRCRKRSIWRPL